MADNNQNQNQIPKEIPKINYDNKKPIPKINFAEFSAPFKDPVPPMLKKKPQAQQTSTDSNPDAPPATNFGMTAEDFKKQSTPDGMMSD